MTTVATLQSLIAQSEPEPLEFKRSTAEPERVGETLCAFLNREGGKVLIVVGPTNLRYGKRREQNASYCRYNDRKRPFELKETVGGVASYRVYEGDGRPDARITRYFRLVVGTTGGTS